jgi:hypothetical protein
MPAEGLVANDFSQPEHEPLNTQPHTHPQTEPEVVTAHEEEEPTLSHSLATEDQNEKGAAQIDHGQTEVKDLGWNEDVVDVPTPLVGGLPNEELWTLVRRFNKVGTILKDDCSTADV